MRKSLTEINAMPPERFVRCFGDVAEHAAWVAEAAAKARPFASRSAMVEAFAEAVRDAEPELQLALLRAHPDLAGKAARAGAITADSRREQSRAGLDSLDPEEFARLTALNERYRKSFGFPFILAVKGATKQQILAAFESRIGNSPEAERATALSQVLRIIGFRLEERVLP
ncbi:MAG: 2-oxo-4-hydroxy-4-carboxy-5-ureidoimidazoline decarboxylase [Aestuariivirgaceae bacterium]